LTRTISVLFSSTLLARLLPLNATQERLRGIDPKGPTDINPASTQDLEKLPDVAAAEAQAIIAGSPYANTSDVNEIKLSQLAEQRRQIQR
jgi:hypothetical protein